jgi:inner membrane protein
MAGGLLPDADVAINSPSDPIIFYKYHRHFTHALLVAPLLGLIVAGGLYWLKSINNIGFKWAWLLATIGVLTHGPLDATTNYGTHLLWPMTNARESWNIMPIIEPVFTLTLMGLLVIATTRNSTKWVLPALLFTSIYFAAGTVQHFRAVSAVEAIAASRGHVPVRLTVLPTIGNLFVWRGQYEADNRIFIDGYRLGLDPTYYQGSSVALLHPSELKLPTGSRQAEALDFFTFFTNGWISLTPTVDGKQAVGDIRFGGLPNNPAPLWGLVFDSAQPNAPPIRAELNNRVTRQLPLFWHMVTGQNPGKPIPAARKTL